MRTLIITGSEESMWNVLDLTLNSKYKWCQANGYDILIKRTWPDKPKLNFKGDLNHLGFLRAVACFEQLRYYDVVMWLDGDSIITNQNYKIEDFIDYEHSFFASYNWMFTETPTGEFTTGNFILTNTNSQDVENLYIKFIEVSKHFLNHVCQELITLNTIYKEPNFKRMMKILPHKYLNSCPNLIAETPTWKNDTSRGRIVSPWNEESFLAHLTGCSNQERYDMLTTYFKSYI